VFATETFSIDELPTVTVPKSTDDGVATSVELPSGVDPEPPLKTIPPHPRIPAQETPINT
jgi:hypothetical protein